MTHGICSARLKKLFEELEFRTFAQRLSTFLSLGTEGPADIKVQSAKGKMQNRGETGGQTPAPDLFSGEPGSFEKKPERANDELRLTIDELKHTLRSGFVHGIPISC